MNEERIDVSPIPSPKNTSNPKMFINLDLIQKNMSSFEHINYKIDDLDVVIENFKKELETNITKYKA